MSLSEMSNWADRLSGIGKFGEMESLILQIGAGEYLAQLQGGLIMSQGEIARLSDVGGDPAKLQTEAIQTLVAKGNTDAARKRLVELMMEAQGAASFGATGLDEEFEMVTMAGGALWCGRVSQFEQFGMDEGSMLLLLLLLLLLLNSTSKLHYNLIPILPSMHCSLAS